MTVSTKSNEKDLQDLKSKISEDIGREIDMEELISSLLEVGSNRYKELIELLKRKEKQNTENSRFDRAKSYILTDMKKEEKQNISGTIDKIVYG